MTEEKRVKEKEPVWLTPEQVADELQVHPSTVRRWLVSGRMRGKKFGQFWRVLSSELKPPVD